MELEDLQNHKQGNAATAAATSHNNGSVTDSSKSNIQSNNPPQIKKEENSTVKDEDVAVETLEDWLKVGTKLEVEWGGEWWDGVVKEMRVNT